MLNLSNRAKRRGGAYLFDRRQHEPVGYLYAALYVKLTAHLYRLFRLTDGNETRFRSHLGFGVRVELVPNVEIFLNVRCFSIATRLTARLMHDKLIFDTCHVVFCIQKVQEGSVERADAPATCKYFSVSVVCAYALHRIASG